MKFKGILKTSYKVTSTGLFGYRILQASNGFKNMADDALERSARIVESVTKSESNYELLQTVKRLDKLSDLLCCVIDSAQLIQFVHPDQDVRRSAADAFMKLSNYMNSLNTNLDLYLKLKSLMHDPSLSSQLSKQEKIVGNLLLKDFQKSGITMPRDKKELFVHYHDKILELGNIFMNQSCSQEEDLIIPTKDLSGLIPSSKKYIRVAPNSNLAHLILHKAKDSGLRRKVFVQMNSAAKEQVDVLQNLLETRALLANLLNEKSYSHMFLKDKMVRNPEHAYSFLSSLANYHMPYAQYAVMKLNQLKNIHNGGNNGSSLDPWDIYYYNQFVPSIPKQTYMALDKVFDVLDYIFNSLFGITLELAEISPGEVWHQDVCKINVIDSKQGKIGTIYCDLFERESDDFVKFDHPAHFTIRCSRKVLDGDDTFLDSDDEPKFLIDPSSGKKHRYQIPIVVLVTSFKRPKIDNHLPLLHLKEIETVFHEMGHALHSMMARTDFQHVSGTRVPVDFVEVPSIFMETFASKLTFSDNGPCLNMNQVSLPTYSEIIEKQNQIQLSILDQEYHTLNSNSFSCISTTEILSKVQSQFHCIPYIPGTAWQVQFSHLYSYGSYYYSYVWSKKWSSRIHAKLLKGKNPEELREVGDLLNKELLGPGGSRDPWVGLTKLGLVLEGEEEGDYANSKHENFL